MPMLAMKETVKRRCRKKKKTKDAWDIVVDVAQILSALGTCGAVIVSLHLSSRGRKPTARVVLDVHRFPFVQPILPTEGRLVITNTGDREAVVLAARWRVRQKPETEHLVSRHYDDDENRVDLTWANFRPGVPYPFVVPYAENVRHLRTLLGLAGPLPRTRLQDVYLEHEFATGDVHKERLPSAFAAEITKYSELEIVVPNP